MEAEMNPQPAKKHAEPRPSGRTSTSRSDGGTTPQEPDVAFRTLTRGF